MSQRLTGTATAPATTSANDRLPQKSTLSSPASIAPGTASMMPLSTISIVAMLSVSEASAIGTTAPNASPARSSGRLVRRVAEEERERDRQRDGPELREARARCR